MAGKSTGNGRTSRQGLKLLERRQKVFELWRAGEMQSTIAKQLRLTRSTVWLDIQIMLKDWREEHRGSISEHIEHELQRLNLWELKLEEKYDETGECCYAEQAMKCGIERRKLLGLDAPSRREIKSEVTLARTFKPSEELHREVSKKLEQFRRARESSPN